MEDHVPQSPRDSSEPIGWYGDGFGFDWFVAGGCRHGSDGSASLRGFGILFLLTACPEDMIEYGKRAPSRGIRVIIAGAGGAAHLRYARFRHRSTWRIIVPVRLKNLEGMDSLLSIVQMPAGVPVATVSINGARRSVGSPYSGSGTDAFAQQVHADLRRILSGSAPDRLWTGAALQHPVAEAKARQSRA